MDSATSISGEPAGLATDLTALLLAIPPERRAVALQAALRFQPGPDVNGEFEIGPLRAALATYWESRRQSAVPIVVLRTALEPPLPVETVLLFNRFAVVKSPEEVESALGELVDHLGERNRGQGPNPQRSLFPADSDSLPSIAQEKRPIGTSVHSLRQLVDEDRRFPTIYADPPWPYENVASRAAAANHYATMSLEQICSEPVLKLAEQNAHLHLWTTNAFLRESFQVMDAWGFRFRSCLVWVKPEIGMGNYWRVSHEFLCDRSHKKTLMWCRGLCCVVMVDL